MRIEFDTAKNARNIAERGISFEIAAAFEFEHALIARDERYAYDEPRYQALGPIGGVLHMLVFCVRGDALRVISLRRANKRERARYDEAGP